MYTVLFGMLTLIGLNAPAEETQSIEWLSWEEMIERQQEEPKKVMVDIYTDWCGWCKKLNKDVFQNQVITGIINKYYYAVKMDGEYSEDIEFEGTTFKFVASGRRGYHELPAALMQGKMSYPTVVFLDEEIRVIQPLPGYRGASEYEGILAYFGSGAYTDTEFETFLASYESGL